MLGEAVTAVAVATAMGGQLTAAGGAPVEGRFGLDCEGGSTSPGSDVRAWRAFDDCLAGIITKREPGRAPL